MKFIHVTDIHVMARNPKYRKDNFLETALKKIKWVQDYAESVGARAILCTGDLFDRADTAYSVLNDLMPIMQDSKVPWISIIGNHDEFGYNPNTITRTPMGTLLKSGVIEHVSYENPKIYKPDFAYTDGVVITGCDSTVDTDNREDKEYDYGILDGNELCARYTSDDHITTIHLSHGFLADKDWGDKIHHTQISEIADKVKADIILCGHEHSGFGINHTTNGKIFINPGALCRITAGSGDINRNVNIAEITIENGYIDAKLVPVEVAQDVDEVIDMDRAMEEKDRVNRLQSFTQTINEVNVTHISMNPFEAIDAISDEIFNSMGVPAEMFNQITIEAKRAIQEAHEKIGGEL